MVVTTPQSSAASCPPCHGNCNQGRTCPAHCSGGCEGGTRDCDCAGAVIGRYAQPRPRWQFLASALVLALSLVTGAYVLVSLAEMGWRALP